MSLQPHPRKTPPPTAHGRNTNRSQQRGPYTRPQQPHAQPQQQHPMDSLQHLEQGGDGRGGGKEGRGTGGRAGGGVGGVFPMSQNPDLDFVHSSRPQDHQQYRNNDNNRRNSTYPHHPVARRLNSQKIVSSVDYKRRQSQNQNRISNNDYTRNPLDQARINQGEDIERFSYNNATANNNANASDPRKRINPTGSATWTKKPFSSGNFPPPGEPQWKQQQRQLRQQQQPQQPQQPKSVPALKKIYNYLDAANRSSSSPPPHSNNSKDVVNLLHDDPNDHDHQQRLHHNNQEYNNGDKNNDDDNNDDVREDQDKQCLAQQQQEKQQQQQQQQKEKQTMGNLEAKIPRKRSLTTTNSHDEDEQHNNNNDDCDYDSPSGRKTQTNYANFFKPKRRTGCATAHIQPRNESAREKLASAQANLWEGRGGGGSGGGATSIATQTHRQTRQDQEQQQQQPQRRIAASRAVAVGQSKELAISIWDNDNSDTEMKARASDKRMQGSAASDSRNSNINDHPQRPKRLWKTWDEVKDEDEDCHDDGKEQDHAYKDDLLATATPQTRARLQNNDASSISSSRCSSSSIRDDTMVKDSNRTLKSLPFSTSTSSNPRSSSSSSSSRSKKRGSSRIRVGNMSSSSNDDDDDDDDEDYRDHDNNDVGKSNGSNRKNKHKKSNNNKRIKVIGDDDEKQQEPRKEASATNPLGAALALLDAISGNDCDMELPRNYQTRRNQNNNNNNNTASTAVDLVDTPEKQTRTDMEEEEELPQTTKKQRSSFEAVTSAATSVFGTIANTVKDTVTHSAKAVAGSVMIQLNKHNSRSSSSFSGASCSKRTSNTFKKNPPKTNIVPGASLRIRPSITTTSELRRSSRLSTHNNDDRKVPLRSGTMAASQSSADSSSTNNVRPRTRSQGTMHPKSKKAPETIEIDDNDDDDDETSIVNGSNSSNLKVKKGKSELSPFLFEMDAIRIAIGKKIFTSDCQFQANLTTNRFNISFRFDKTRQKSQTSTVGSIEQCRFSVDAIQEFKYYSTSVPDDEYSNISNNCSSDDPQQPMSFLAMQIQPSPANGLSLFSKSYDGLKEKKRYIVVEFRDDSQLTSLLTQLKESRAWVPYLLDSKLSSSTYASYGAVLLDHYKKEKESRLSALSSPPQKKLDDPFLAGRALSDILVVYPFPGDAAAIEQAADGLNEAKRCGMSYKSAQARVVDRKTVAAAVEGIDEASETEDPAKQSGSSGRGHFLTIRVGDYERLEPGEYLNDTLIDFWMQWIARNDDRSKVHFFSSHFYSALSKKGPQGVLTWTRNKNINVFEKDMIFIPINQTLHWSLCLVVNPGDIANSYNEKNASDDDRWPGIYFFDSLKAHRKLLVAAEIRRWLNWEYKRLCSAEANTLNIKLKTIHDYENKWDSFPFDKRNMPVISPIVPYQSNGWDCGVFVCRYAYAMYELARRVERITFAQAEDENFIPTSPEFIFDMSDIARIREEMQLLIQRLSKVYLPWKEEETRKEKAAKKARRSKRETAPEDAQPSVTDLHSSTTMQASEEADHLPPVEVDGKKSHHFSSTDCHLPLKYYTSEQNASAPSPSKAMEERSSQVAEVTSQSQKPMDLTPERKVKNRQRCTSPKSRILEMETPEQLSLVGMSSLPITSTHKTSEKLTRSSSPKPSNNDELDTCNNLLPVLNEPVEDENVRDRSSIPMEVDQLEQTSKDNEILLSRADDGCDSSFAADAVHLDVLNSMDSAEIDSPHTTNPCVKPTSVMQKCATAAPAQPDTTTPEQVDNDLYPGFSAATVIASLQSSEQGCNNMLQQHSPWPSNETTTSFSEAV